MDDNQLQEQGQEIARLRQTLRLELAFLEESTRAMFQNLQIIDFHLVGLIFELVKISSNTYYLCCVRFVLLFKDSDFLRKKVVESFVRKSRKKLV